MLAHVTAKVLRRLARDEWLVPVTTGVLARPTVPDATARAWAGHLIAGPASALGGAMVLHRAGLVPVPTTVEVWTPAKSPALRPRRGWVFRRDGSDRLSRVVGTLPGIRLEQALIDVGQGQDLETWVALVLDAVSRGTTSVAGVRAALAGRSRGRERSERLDVLGDLLGLESGLEFRYARDVERAHGLPVGERQASVSAGTRSDVRLAAWHTLIELDGRLGHDGSGVFRDAWRDNAHAIGSDVTLRYGSVAVRSRPCSVAFQIAARLRNQGWTGSLRRCRRCPPPDELALLASATGWRLSE
ncbi:MAG: hypothetical protein Q4F65_03240 [Propionibacteriaceae bacterium]|nr:hypothetical protein [Propionibacteriaceae bacterium]